MHKMYYKGAEFSVPPTFCDSQAANHLKW